MKLKITFFALIGALSLSAQDFKTPLDYMNYMAKETENISKQTWKYTSAVAHSKSPRKIEATRKTLLKAIQAAQLKIGNLKGGYKGDVDYRNDMLAYLTFEEMELNQEYDKILDLQEISEKSYDAMEAYIRFRDAVNDKISSETDKINASQLTFAGKHNIQIVEGETAIGKKMKKTGEVYDYHTDLFLIFFKANIAETGFMNAIEAKDAEGIAKNMALLQTAADEGLAKLATMKGYENDMAMIASTKKAMEFFRKEATEYAPAALEFISSQNKMEEANKALEAKKEKDRTKEDINDFNKMVAQSNKAVVAYNRVLNKYNTERANVTNSWNNTTDSFISRHVPQD